MPPGRKAPTRHIPFLDAPALERIATGLLHEANCKDLVTDLTRLAGVVISQQGLRVNHGVVAPVFSGASPTLAAIDFDDVTIDLFAQSEPHIGRDRFAFAHVLAHAVLGHGPFLRSEFCDERNFHVDRDEVGPDLFALEWQANTLASMLLMPFDPIIDLFREEMNRLGVAPTRSQLYVDDQDCNVEALMFVTYALSSSFKVPREFVATRLKMLRLLVEDRSLRHVGNHLRNGAIKIDAEWH